MLRKDGFKSGERGGQSAGPVCTHMRPGTVEDQEEPRTQCASVGTDIPVLKAIRLLLAEEGYVSL